MKKSICMMCCVAVLLAALLPAFGTEVVKDEVSAANGDTITFINYEGPHDSVDTYKEIGEIGSGLGAAIQAGTAGDKSRYYVIHAIDDAVSNGFDADILILGANAGVDHIRNLRHIIASYLSSAYGYSVRDSETLARFITVYNAVYRGQIDIFEQRYKPVVMQYVTKEKAGLSTYWEDWAGKTQILIPLTGSVFRGTISTVDTTTITDNAVITSMQEADDKSIDDRKNMTDIKDRESEAAEQQAQEAEQAAKQKDSEITQQEAAIEDQKKKTEEQKKQVIEQKKEITQLESQETRTPEEEQILSEKKEEVANTEAQIVLQEEDTAQQESAVEQKKAESNDLKQEAEQASDLSEKKNTEVQQDRQSIVDDQKTLIAQEDNKSAEIAGITGLRVIDTVQLLSELVTLNASTGVPLKTSVLHTIRGRTLITSGSSYIAIAGTKNEGAIRLVEIDGTTLDILNQGTDNIAESSMLIAAGGCYYAVIETTAGCKVGKFDNSLKCVAMSTVSVSPVTMITVNAGLLMVQDETQTMIMLNSADLTKK